MLRSLEHYKEANGGSIEIPEMPPAAGDDGDGIPEANGGMFEMPELPSAGDGEGSPEAKLDMPEIPSAGDGESPEIPSAGDGTGRKEAKRLEKLRRWCESQLHHQRRCSMGYAGSGNLTEEKIEKLRGIGFRLAPSYDEMYERLVAARVGAHAAGITGPPEVDDGEDGELSEWAKEQKKMMARHSKGQPIPLSNDRIGKLISVAAEAEVQAEAAAAADEDSEAFIPSSDSDDSDDSPLAKRTKSGGAKKKKAPAKKRARARAKTATAPSPPSSDSEYSSDSEEESASPLKRSATVSSKRLSKPKRTKKAAPAKKAPPAKKLKKTTDKVCATSYEFIYYFCL